MFQNTYVYLAYEEQKICDGPNYSYHKLKETKNYPLLKNMIVEVLKKGKNYFPIK